MDFGGHLASIHTMTDYTALDRAVTNAGVTDGVFVGAYEDETDVWRWTDGTAMDHDFLKKLANREHGFDNYGGNWDEDVLAYCNEACALARGRVKDCSGWPANPEGGGPAGVGPCGGASRGPSRHSPSPRGCFTPYGSPLMKHSGLQESDFHGPRRPRWGLRRLRGPRLCARGLLLGGPPQRPSATHPSGS